MPFIRLIFFIVVATLLRMYQPCRFAPKSDLFALLSLSLSLCLAVLSTRRDKNYLPVIYLPSSVSRTVVLFLLLRGNLTMPSYSESKEQNRRLNKRAVPRRNSGHARSPLRISNQTTNECLNQSLGLFFYSTIELFTRQVA